MRHLSALVVMALSILIIASCDLTPPILCAGVGYNAVRVAIRDQEGNPQALGAQVTLYDGTYIEQDHSQYDPLNVNAANERGGRTYDIQISKPYYNDSWVRGVRAPGGGCVTGHESKPVTITVNAILTVAANAPPVRSIHLLPFHIVLDRPPYADSVRLVPYVDANGSAARAVSWRISGDTGSVSFNSTTGTVRYRCRPTSGYITVKAVSVLDSTVFGIADVAVQGHPAIPSDPPCS